ncbi:MAG: hypothetical protein AAF412_08500, partial [Pseudomonadota bacterium]
ENTDKAAISLRKILSIDWSNALIFAVVYLTVKVLHELGHALAYQTYCRKAGLNPGPIRTGIAVFALTPFPFTDVTGAWRLSSRWQRAMIGAGGLYFETWIIALLTLIWSQTQSGVITDVILQVAIVAGLLTMFFNLNPAVKLDGYYVLTDLIKRPNLAQKASVAARSVVVRILGGTAKVDRFDLGYWFVSYLYRWIIFVGIFWLSYQFDPRLAPVVAIITLMMLFVRPIVATVKYAKPRGIKMWRSSMAFGVAICTVFALFIPLPDRVLLNGHFENVETRFVEPTENGVLLTDDAVIRLINHDLTQQLQDTRLRTEILSNTARSVTATAAERASLAKDISSLKVASEKMQSKLNGLQVKLPDAAAWTSLDGMAYEGSWMARASARIGAISLEKPGVFALNLEQNRLEEDLQSGSYKNVKIRLEHNPLCQFDAELRLGTSELLVIDGRIKLQAHPNALPECAKNLHHGSAVVARLSTKPKTVIERVHISVSRLLQDRLPVNIN